MKLKRLHMSQLQSEGGVYIVITLCCSFYIKI